MTRIVDNYTFLRFAVICLLATCYIGPSAFGQAGTTSYLYQENSVFHPDGKLGKPFVNAMIGYSSVSKKPGFAVTDAQQLVLSTGVVLSPRFTLFVNTLSTKEDSIRYQFDSALRLYLRHPLHHTGNSNPDGPVGWPVLTAGYGALYAGTNEDTYNKFYLIQLTWPLSTKLTGALSHTGYNTLPEFIGDGTSIGLNIFFSSYPSKKRYINPDLPVGSIALQLRYGMSDNGNNGTLSVLFGLSEMLTILTQASYVSLDTSFERLLNASIGCQWYP